MKQTHLILMATCLLLASTAKAQLDPDPDDVGIFFDLDATVNCIEAYVTPVECYIMILNPSESSGIGGMSATFELSPTLIFLGLNCPGDIILPPPWPEFQVFFVSPLPAEPVVPICSFTIFPLDLSPAFLTIHDAHYIAGDDPGLVIPLHPMTHYDYYGNPNPVAAVNAGADLCPVPGARTTWGGLKALYN